MKELRINHWPNTELSERLAENDLEAIFLGTDKKDRHELTITREEIRQFAKTLVDEFNLANPHSKIEQFHILELFSDDIITKRFLSDYENQEEEFPDDLLPDLHFAVKRIRRALVEEVSQLIDPQTFALVRSVLSDKVGEDGKSNTHYRLDTPVHAHHGRRLVERGGRHLAHSTDKERQDMISAHTALYQGHQDHMRHNGGKPYPHILFEKSLPAEVDAREHLVEEIPGLQMLDSLLISEDNIPRFDTTVRIFCETVEACEWLASKNLLLQDLKIENIGVYDGPDHKDTAILSDLEGLIDYTRESSRHSIVTDKLNQVPEAAPFVSGVADILPERSPSEMVYQLGLVLRDIYNAYTEPTYPLSRLTQIYLEMTKQDPKERISLHEVHEQIKELITTLKK